VTSGTVNPFAPGTYTVSEDLSSGPSGYTQTGIPCGSLSGTGSVTVTLSAGDTKTCTITNSDAPALPLDPQLQVKKGTYRWMAEYSGDAYNGPAGTTEMRRTPSRLCRNNSPTNRRGA
jgi:hypothetical protein